MITGPVNLVTAHEITEVRQERRVAVRDRSGRVVGHREHQHLAGRTLARDVQVRVLGVYDHRRRVTVDASGRLIGHGDLLAALLFRVQP